MLPKPFLMKSQSWISALLSPHKESRMRRARQTVILFMAHPLFFRRPSSASPGETQWQMLWQRVLPLWKFIASDVCLGKKKEKKRPDSSLKLSSPALRNDKGESWSSPSLYAFSSVSLMCLSGAVEEQNSKSIKQLVYPSPWLSPGKIYWLQQQPEHTGTSSFLRGWLDIESHTGPWAWYYHRAQACHLERHGGLFPLPHFMSEGADLFQCLTTNPPALEAVLWNGGSFLINSDLLIFTETSLRFYSIFLLSF